MVHPHRIVIIVNSLEEWRRPFRMLPGGLLSATLPNGAVAVSYLLCKTFDEFGDNNCVLFYIASFTQVLLLGSGPEGDDVL